ncbi:MAG: glycosyltransferase family 39 protein [Patescibacteria group bacterium]
MSKKINFVKLLLILILILAAILRFYKLPEYLQFLGDQGRDLLIVKAMIVDHKFTLLGPTASVGGFYTGPVYYYFMLPFLALWQLDPVGPAVMSALFGLATIILVYFFVKDIADKKAGVLAALLTAFSPKMIDLSRFSWNPNPIPFFSLAAVYSLYKRKVFLAGLFVGILVQLHYINLVMIPVIGLMTKIKDWWKLFIGFFAGLSLFLIFELRHGFPNSQSVMEFIFRGGQTVAPRTFNFPELFIEIYRRTFENVFQTSDNLIFNIVIYLALFIFLWQRKWPLIVWLILGCLGLGFYRGTLYEHYFNFLYILPFIILGIVLTRRWFLIPIAVFFLYLSVIKWYIWSPPNNQIGQTKNVDKVVMDMLGGEDFNFALITPGNSDHAYRYFLELNGKKAKVIYNPDIDPERKSVASQLIVVCEGPCAPLGSPLWEVAGFGRAEIADSKQVPVGITVYKLVHYKGG